MSKQEAASRFLFGNSTRSPLTSCKTWSNLHVWKELSSSCLQDLHAILQQDNGNMLLQKTGLPGIHNRTYLLHVTELLSVEGWNTHKANNQNVNLDPVNPFWLFCLHVDLFWMGSCTLFGCGSSSVCSLCSWRGEHNSFACCIIGCPWRQLPRQKLSLNRV